MARTLALSDGITQAIAKAFMQEDCRCWKGFTQIENFWRSIDCCATIFKLKFFPSTQGGDGI